MLMARNLPSRDAPNFHSYQLAFEVTRSSLIRESAVQRATQLYQSIAYTWKGCDWSTRFGSQRLELKGLNHLQARLMAAATPGEESKCWLAATDWLETVESDAQLAELAARRSVEILPHSAAMALKQIRYACQLERKYRAELVWLPLHDEILRISRSHW